ncbi:hypothetical protein PROPHIGD54-2_154 [Mycobacterium phage prophiGD54-2]|nr:hypothetical protein PROPHIGD54-2_154 [Mycobacterium phage prophiGD54-2]
MSTVNVHGDDYTIVKYERITGCGSKFDGRVKFTLRRVSDGQEFKWLGSRTSKTVPSNARLS